MDMWVNKKKTTALMWIYNSIGEMIDIESHNFLNQNLYVNMMKVL